MAAFACFASVDYFADVAPFVCFDSLASFHAVASVASVTAASVTIVC